MNNDSDLQAMVLERLRLDARVAPEDIGVAVRDGVVTLHGEVSSLAKRAAAVHVTQAVPGVTAIANDISVRIPGDHRRSDVDIAHDVVNALIWDTDVPDKTIKARVQDQWVWLVGECDWHYQREAAQRAIENVTGLKGVVNAVHIKRGRPNPMLQADVERAIGRHAVLSSRAVRVSVQNGSTVVLSGAVASWDERAAAEQAAWSAAGVVSVENQLEIAP